MVGLTLMQRMRDYARSKKWPADHPFFVHADALDKACEEGNAVKICGAWARARKLWCDETGEPLV